MERAYFFQLHLPKFLFAWNYFARLWISKQIMTSQETEIKEFTWMFSVTSKCEVNEHSFLKQISPLPLTQVICI